MTSWRFINLKRLSKMRSWTIEVSSGFPWTAWESLESFESWKSWKLLDLFFINRVGFCKSNKLSWSSLICLRAFIAITLAIMDSKRAEFSFKLSISCSQLGQSTKQIDELVQCQINKLLVMGRAPFYQTLNIRAWSSFTELENSTRFSYFLKPEPKKTQSLRLPNLNSKKPPKIETDPILN